MAPKRGESLERSDEREEFMKELTEYHEHRGTILDPEPKIGPRHVDLFRLYQRVVDEGGYDMVSDVKAKPLMWRKMAEEFIGKNQSNTAQAFQMKNIYYKNLVAYEISTHWQQEPPPKEILEEVTAKGGNVMSRTLDNYERPKPREQENLVNGDASDTSPEQKTPKEERTESVEEPGSATGRSTRGLRQQPPQRVLFQPDLTSARQTRGQNQTSYHGSPTPGVGINGVMNASSLTNGASSTLASYEPPQAYPLSLKPVITPSNNPEFYRNERKRKAETNVSQLAKKYKNIMLPGTGFIGPNIYIRAQLALQSGIQDEEQYALHHLVKISHERGDKYRFDQFPGLADALTKKVLEVTSLFYDVDWDVMYDEEFFAGDEETLNGLDGTPDAVQRLNSRTPLISNDSVLDSGLLSKLNRITEAGLVIRNMSLQEENAAYLARLPLVRDLIAIVLHLPNHSCIIELRQSVLDICEQILKYLELGPQDAIYQGLMLQTLSPDRGVTIVALRAISRIAMTYPSPLRLDNVPITLLRRIQDLLNLEDEEMRSSCLDFLGQYTSFSDTVEHLLQSVDAEALVRQLSRLALFTAKEYREKRPVKRPGFDTHATSVPRLAKKLVESLLKLEEPERSSEWLRMCFLPDSSAEMTQISLWQAYQGTFAPYNTTHPHLIAGDFIKNVSTTFPGATAQVAGSNKYVIKGIKPRKAPIDTGTLADSKAGDKGKELHCCHWRSATRLHTPGLLVPSSREQECALWFKDGDDMLKHILSSHLQLPASTASPKNNDQMDIDSKPNGVSATTPDTATSTASRRKLIDLVDWSAADQSAFHCRWSRCERVSSDFDSGNVSRTLLFIRHIETHLPETESSPSKYNVSPEVSSLGHQPEITRLTILEDEKGEATGIPLRAVLVLRNMARFMPKQMQLAHGRSATKSGQKQEERIDLMSAIFDADVKNQLFYAMTHSNTMRDYVGMVFRAIKMGGT